MLNSIEDVPGIYVGNAERPEALTGCTVVLAENGATGGVDVRGSAPGTRETDLLSPLNLVSQVNAVCLAGGSAYGLDAATGVMQFLEEQGLGLDVGVGVVPIVPSAVLFDLHIGDPRVRPDAAMGYQAGKTAYERSVDSKQVNPEKKGAASEPSARLQGNVGAGCGASVGKLAGIEHAVKSGLGTASLQAGNGLVVGAIVAVNALGNIRDPETGQIIAGARHEDNGFIPVQEQLARMQPPISPGTNTTIAVVASNAKFDKAQATKVAQMAQDGLARCIDPVHTMFDGDTVFALATGAVDAAVDLVGSLSAHALTTAVVRAVKAAAPAGGLPSASSLSS